MITQKIAEFAVGLQYEDLGPEVVAQVKRFLLDSVGCAFGGSATRDVGIYLDYCREKGGRGEAALFNSPLRLPCAEAALLNSLMVRALDYNDIYWEQDPSHPSDLIPAALATAEARGRSGKDLITAIALAYEFEMRMCEIAHPGIRERKWHHATLTAFVSPIVAGKMLGLDAGQMVQAIGIAGACHATLGAVTAGHLTMMKNTVDPLAVQAGVVAAELAERGYEGPSHVIDGKEGLTQTLSGSEWDVEGLVRDLAKPFRILCCSMKAFSTEALIHSPVSAILQIRQEHDLPASEIEEITIFTIARAVDILADPSKYNPTTRETADHSLPYCIAALVLDGELTPVQFRQERINAPDIRALLEKVKVVSEPRFEKMFPARKPAAAVVRTSSGKTWRAEVEYPRGDYRNPLTDTEVEQKFQALAATGGVPRAKAGRVVESIRDLENCRDVRELMRVFSAQQGRSLM